MVDSYNLASIRTRIAIAAFDLASLRGELVMRKAREGEEFKGIGMSKPVSLKGREIVLSDFEGPVAIYPYRDSERGKITEGTRDALFVICGVPGIGEGRLIEAAGETSDIVRRFCDGVVSTA